MAQAKEAIAGDEGETIMISQAQHDKTAAVLGTKKGETWTRHKIADVLRALVPQAEAGDTAAIAKVESLLSIDFIPDMMGGDLAYLVSTKIIEGFTSNELYRSTLHAKLVHLRAELSASGQGTAVERLLIDRVAISWLHLHRLELEYEHNRKKGLSIPMENSLQRCITQADRRYQSAIRSLAVVRKLAAPVLAKNVRVILAAPGAQTDAQGEGGRQSGPASHDPAAGPTKKGSVHHGSR
jgi:hypothetical protein